MYKIFSYIQIVLYALYQYLRPGQKEGDTRRVLVLMDQVGVGDAISSLDSFYNLALHAPGRYELYIAATSQVVRFLEGSRSTFQAHLIELDLERAKKFQFGVFKKNYKKLSNHTWYSIISLNRIGLYLKLLLWGCKQESLIGMEFYEQKIGGLEKFIQKSLRNFQCMYFHDDRFIMQIYGELVLYFLNRVIGKNTPFLRYSIPDNLEQNPLQSEKTPYCIICPSIGMQADHPFQFRRWPLDRFVWITDFILSHSKLSVCLCGVAADEADNYYVASHSRYPSRIINMTGKTSFQGWIELIRNAKFVFGNDSGYIHLAAYLNVESFVLAGYWNYGRFLPYKGLISDGMRKPIDIRIPRVSCIDCSRVKRNDSTKRQCDYLVKEKGVYKCVWDISVNQAAQTLMDSGLLD